MSENTTLQNILKNRLTLNNSQLNENVSDRIKKLQEKMQKLPSVLDKDTLSKLRNGEYGITLKEYTTMTTYNNTMSALYGNNSSDPFQQTLSKILGTENTSLNSAKSFVEKLKEQGFSNSSAVKMYSALKKYSLMSSFNNYNFVKATV